MSVCAEFVATLLAHAVLQRREHTPNGGFVPITYPYDPQRSEQLTSVFYTAITPTAADRDRFEQAVLTKYSEPLRYVKGALLPSAT